MFRLTYLVVLLPLVLFASAALPANDAEAQVVTYVPQRVGLFGWRRAYRPVVTYPAPVTTYYAPSPVTTYYAPSAPVTTYYAPAPATTYYAPSAPVRTYYAPTAPVTTYYAPAPVTTYYAPRPIYYWP